MNSMGAACQSDIQSAVYQDPASRAAGDAYGSPGQSQQLEVGQVFFPELDQIYGGNCAPQVPEQGMNRAAGNLMPIGNVIIKRSINGKNSSRSSCGSAQFRAAL